jgi:hypothetical protein
MVAETHVARTGKYETYRSGDIEKKVLAVFSLEYVPGSLS